MKVLVISIAALVVAIVGWFASSPRGQAFYSSVVYPISTAFVDRDQEPICTQVGKPGFTSSDSRVPYGYTEATISFEQTQIPVDSAGKDLKTPDELNQLVADSNWRLTVEVMGISPDQLGLEFTKDDTSLEQSQLSGLSAVSDCIYKTDKGERFHSTRLEFAPYMGRGNSGNDFKPEQWTALYSRPTLLLPVSVVDAVRPVRVRYKDAAWIIGLWWGYCAQPLSVCSAKWIESKFF